MKQSVFIALTAFFVATAAQAATFTVTSTADPGNGVCTVATTGDGCTLREAIAAANTAAGDDTISFAPGVSGIIQLTAPLPDLSTNIAVQGPGAGALTVRRDTGGDYRIFNVSNGTTSGPTVSVSGLTIANGRVTSGLIGGSGIFNDFGKLTLTGCTVTGNTQGGIFTRANTGAATSLNVTNCTLTGNGGAAISVFITDAGSSANVVVTGCAISGNGSGISLFSNKTANLTGAISACTVTGGTSGGVAFSADDNAMTNVTVTACTISANSGFRGAGVINFGQNGGIGALTLLNSTIANNTATIDHAGGLYNSAGAGTANAIVKNCTFSGNTGPVSAISNDAIAGSTCTVQLGNSILKAGGSGSNITNEADQSSTATFTSLGYNLSSDTGNLVLTQTGDQINIDPKLDPAGLKDNGGPTQTIALQPGSPALDKGNSFGAPNDQRGQPRPVNDLTIPPAPGGDNSDIGAFEFNPGFQPGPALTVTTTEDHNDGSGCTPTDCTLREAIIAAGTLFGNNVISFAPGVTGIINLASALPILSTDIEINGPGANKLTVRRDTGGNYRIFTISNSTESGPTVKLSGLTLSNGQGVGSGTVGGCIFNDFATLTINRCALLGNHGGNGAGILNFRGTVTVTDSTISGNAATGFGGAFFNNAAQGPATLTLTNCTISGNSAARGAAIHNPGTTGDAGVMLQNCTLATNTSVLGGIYNDGANAMVTLSNTILSAATGNANIVVANGAQVVSQGNNLSSDSGGNSLTGSGDMINTDPMLNSAGLANNGGPTQTVALLTGSPAINAGNDGNAPPIDQRGFGRAGISDIGAFEFAGLVSSTLANLSTRLRVETGDNVLIGGFIITGAAPKKVLLRAIGPSLPFAGTLDNPTLELRDSTGALLASNDDWMNSSPTDKQAIIDSTIPPSNDLESAIVRTLPANSNGYTAIVRGVNNGTGIGVVEAYDLDRSVDSKLANISTRGFVQTGDNVLIAGTIVLGQVSQKILVRAIGPSLSFPGTLADPTLELRDQNAGLIAANNDWRTSQEAEIKATTIPPTNDSESAIVAILPSNGANYTAIVRGVNDSTGIAVVEIFALQ